MYTFCVADTHFDLNMRWYDLSLRKTLLTPQISTVFPWLSG